MSKVQKSKKLRRPNIPLDSQPRTAVGGGEETAPALRPAQMEQVHFDYTHIKKDLTSILVLVVSFIVVLLGLSLAMPYIVK